MYKETAMDHSHLKVFSPFSYFFTSHVKAHGKQMYSLWCIFSLAPSSTSKTNDRHMIMTFCFPSRAKKAFSSLSSFRCFTGYPVLRRAHVDWIRRYVPKFKKDHLLTFFQAHKTYVCATSSQKFMREDWLPRGVIISPRRRTYQVSFKSLTSRIKKLCIYISFSCKVN